MMKNVFVLLLALTLGACATAQFPEIEEPSSSALESDSKNAIYEDVKPQPRKPVVVEDTKVVKKADNNKVDAKKVVAKKEVEPKKEVAIAEPKKEEAKVEEVVESSGPSIELLKATIYFADGSSSVYGSEKQIRDVAKFVKANDAKVKVVGHSSSRTLNTDPVSHKMANFNASLRRAQNTAKALEKAGVDKDDIIVEAVSDARPAYQEVMPEGERLNRRAEIYVIY